MSLIYMLLFFIEIMLVQGENIVCFKPPKFKIDANEAYASSFINHTNLNPFTLYATFNATRTINRPRAKVVITSFTKRGKDVFMNKEIDICKELEKDKTKDFIFQYFFGDVHKAAKEFNPCPLQPGMYTFPELVFQAKTWIPLFSGGTANVKISFYATEDLKKIWVATTEVRVEFRKAISGRGCPKF